MIPTISLFSFIVIGFAIAFLQSLGYYIGCGVHEITFDHYVSATSRTAFTAGLFFSLYVAFVSTVISVVMALFISSMLVKKEKTKGERILTSIYKLPLLFSSAIAICVVIIFLGSTGLVARVLNGLGVITSSSEFPTLIHDQYGIGIIVGYIALMFSWATLMIYPVMQRVDEELITSARSLGATKFQTFLHITLPLTIPGISVAFTMTFTWAFGAFEVPLMLGRSYPTTLGVLAYNLYTSMNYRSESLAICVMITLMSVAMALISMNIFKRINNENDTRR